VGGVFAPFLAELVGLVDNAFCQPEGRIDRGSFAASGFRKDRKRIAWMSERGPIVNGMLLAIGLRSELTLRFHPIKFVSPGTIAAETNLVVRNTQTARCCTSSFPDP